MCPRRVFMFTQVRKRTAFRTCQSEPEATGSWQGVQLRNSERDRIQGRKRAFCFFSCWQNGSDSGKNPFRRVAIKNTFAVDFEERG